MRLDKLMASQGLGSRADCKKWIRKKQVTVNGAVVTDPGIAVDPEADTVVVSGQTVRYQEHLYLMLNKPLGVVSATEDRDAVTVVDLVPPELSRDGLFPAGRLDADTTGFILLTDDGEFAHRILSPKNHIFKTYVATLKAPVRDSDLQELREGIRLSDGTRCLPAEVSVLDPHTVQIRICEGKYHQIRRMFAAAGNRVLALTRTAMGTLPLDPSLAPGACRELTEEERARITERP
ncbi:MAG: rRNA pseudouridine synthase [Clostridia bacterium]|nr:rRNA pseudouridine synthase [Clostridia bacterium]